MSARRSAPWLALAALAVVLGAWWVLGDDEGRDGGQGGHRAGEVVRNPAAERVDPAEGAPAPMPVAVEEPTAAPLQASAEASPPPEPDTSAAGTYTGRLLAADGSPRGDVEVVWVPTPEVLVAAGLAEPSLDPDEPAHRPVRSLGELMPVTRTDDDGRFALTVEGAAAARPPTDAPPAGLREPVIVAHAPDALAVLSTKEHDLGELTLCSEGPFSVEVVDEAGRPVPGTWAEGVLTTTRLPACESGGESQHAVVFPRGLVVPLHPAAPGRFERHDLPTATGTLRAGAPGHATVRRWLSRGARGKEQAPIELPREARLRGLVLGPDGAPAAGCLLTLTSDPGSNYPVHHGVGFRADDDTVLLALDGSSHRGTTRARTDAEGRFDVGALHPTAHDVFVEADGCDVLRVQDVVPDGTPLTLRLETERTLAVTVRDAEGRPVPGAAVTAWRGVMLDPNLLTVDPPPGSGRPFVVHGASPLVTTLEARAPWHQSVVEQVRDGEPAAELTLPRAGALRVVVTRDGAPVEDARVDVTTEGTAPVYTSAGDEPRPRTDARGHAVIEHLRPGRYDATLAHSSTLECAGPVTGTVRAGEWTEVELPVRGQPVVRGRVLGATEQVTLTFALQTDDGHRNRRIRTADDGTFTRAMPSGTYDVRIQNESVATVTLAPDEEHELELPLPVGARIEGRVTCADRPVAGWTARVLGMSDEVVSDDQGRYALDLPGAGRWTLQLFHGKQRVDRVVEVAPGAVAVEDLALPDTTLEARLLSSDGAPVTDVWATVKQLDATVPFPYRAGLRVKPDEQGVVRARWLPAGRWVVEVEHGWSWQERSSAPFNLHEGDRHVVPDLVLVAACTVRGHAFVAPGVALEKGTVLFIRDDGARETTYVGHSGDYDITWIPAGRWQVALVTDTSMAIPPGVGEVLELAPGDDVELDLVMKPLRP